MDDRRAPGRWRTRERVFWSALAVAATALLVAVRDEIAGAHVALAYLLVVLGASARGGRRLGLVLALLGFLAFNFFFIPPYYAFAIHRPLDWLVLFAFLVTSMVATQLLHRAQSEAAAARQRAREIERLAALGAETLSAGRADDAVVAIAHVIQSGLDVAACEIYLDEAEGGPMRRIARVARGGAEAPASPPADARLLQRAAAGLAVAERDDGTESVARASQTQSALEILLATNARELLIPLRVREHSVGVLRLEGDGAVVLDAAQQRFAEALAYYAALGLERVRLTAAAEHADTLREADRLKDALLASVSHDLRTPLTTIKALAHDIALGGDERAAVVEEEADRLNRFVSDLLDLSRLSAGALPLTPELVAVDDVLGAALQQLSGTLNGRTVRMALDPAEPLLVGRFDFVHALRSLVNLIDNALKYSPPAAAVDVSVRREGEWVAFDVADRGPGIAPEERERVFEPFYRGGTPDVGGTGLGLPIARRSADLQGGRLTYRPREGGGSVFTLLLPAATAADLADMSL
jgi:two-component system sensor histidine kinase KdpD